MSADHPQTTIAERRTADEVMSSVLTLPKTELRRDDIFSGGAWFLTPIEAWTLVEEIQRLRGLLIASQANAASAHCEGLS